MKKFLILTAILGLSFTACKQLDTTLEIKNNSSVEITDVSWGGVQFRENPWSSGLIRQGDSVKMKVEEGNEYIFFRRQGDSTAVRTEREILVEANEANIFTFTNDTPIVEVANPANTDTLGNFYLRPNIRVNQDETIINQHGEYNCDPVAIGEFENIVFTIENTGGSNLNIDTVNDNRINLGDNASGFFSVIQQPFANTVIAPENSVTFTIRFSPTAAGDSFTAIVHIKTNSPANEDFSFMLIASAYEKKPQIVVSRDNVVIAQHGDIPIGGVRPGESRDFVFTIENIGEANLTFVTVNNNRINLEDNVAGLFSVIQQPFANTVVAPGGSTTFTIRFSPVVVGNNFTASVHIKTNSQINDEFSFWIRGNGSTDYEIGDTGPGGGIVFFAQGGQYKEVSGELGAYNWSDATTTAGSFNGGSFNDWRLPDRGELDLIYENRNTLGGFQNNTYWSSTVSGSSAWLQNFSTTWLYYGTSGVGPGSQSLFNQSVTARVRAIRAF